MSFTGFMPPLFLLFHRRSASFLLFVAFFRRLCGLDDWKFRLNFVIDRRGGIGHQRVLGQSSFLLLRRRFLRIFFLLRSDFLLRRRFCLLLRRRLCLLLLRRRLRLLLRRLLLRHLLLLLDFLDDDGSFLRASFLLRFRPRKRRLEAFRRFTRPVLCLHDVKEKILRFSLIKVMNALTRGNQERRRRKRRDLNSKSHAKENARTTSDDDANEKNQRLRLNRTQNISIAQKR